MLTLQEQLQIPTPPSPCTGNFPEGVSVASSPMAMDFFNLGFAGIFVGGKSS